MTMLSPNEKTKEEEFLEAELIIGMTEAVREKAEETRKKQGKPSIDEILAADFRDYVDFKYRGETK